MVAIPERCYSASHKAKSLGVWGVTKRHLLPGVALCGLWSATVLAQVSPGAPPSQAPAGQDTTATAQGPAENITVIGATPLLGSGVDRDKVPANTVVIGGSDRTHRHRERDPRAERECRQRGSRPGRW